MKTPIYLTVVTAVLIGVTACQPILPAGTVVAVPAPPPLPPPPPPVTYQAPMPAYVEPAPRPHYNYYVKGPRGNWAAKRCGAGMHWQSSRRVMVKTDGGASASKVIPARCVRN